MTDRRFLARNLVTTADGSHTIYLPAVGEHYHSSFGALRESRHVFLEQGYDVAAACARDRLRVLEIGLGTGLNALLTWDRARHNLAPVAYTALEPFPVTEELACQLNYPDQLAARAARQAFAALHRCRWGVIEPLGEYFSLLKLGITVEDFQPSGEYDLVYYDAFSPAVQPEVWTRSVFEKVFGCMSAGSLLVTYCAQGEVRRNLRSVGFALETLAGPPGKRQMTRATKP